MPAGEYMKAAAVFLNNSVIAAVLTIGIAALSLMNWYPLLTLEYKTYDMRQRLRQKKPVSPVVIVAIDDQSIQKLGRWPWPRAYMAELVDVLAESRPALIATNILYTEADRNFGLDEVRSVRKQIDDGGQVSGRLATVRQALLLAEKRLDSDASMADSLSRSKNVILPFYFTSGEQAAGPVELTDILKRNAILAPESTSFPPAVEQILPIKSFMDVSAGLGHLNIFADEDGTVRREAVLMRHNGYLFPSFALQASLKYLKQDVSKLKVSGHSLSVGQSKIPLDREGRMLIDYRGKFGSFPTYSFIDVAAGRYTADTFRDKIVLIGPVATGISAFEVTPLQSQSFPVIEISANVIDTILSANFISRPAWTRYAELLLMAAIGAFLAFGLPRLKAGVSAIVFVAVLVVWNGVAIWLFASQGQWLAMVAPSLLLISGYIAIVSRRFMAVERHKELVESDSIETSKMLGLSFQGQGLLDLAFEKFRKCPLEDDSVKELLYNLALDFERKRMFNKAAAVYQQIIDAGEFKDVAERIVTMKSAGETMLFGTAGGRKEATVLLKDGGAAVPTIGRFEIQKELGRGAMGTVFLGRDPKINRMVAIKTIRFDELDPVQMDEVKRRFFREAEAAGALNHPNIVTIYDVGEDYDLAYVAMELLDGCDLSDFTRPETRLSAVEVLKVIGAVAEGLAFAHTKGVVHRDIKPANIMRLKNGDIKIADFGIARITASSTTQTGAILGTPSYMSPEQVVGKKVDGRSDLFSLGAVMYELLAGHRPFGGDSIATIMYNIANKPPLLLTKLDPQIPECCAYIAHKLLLKDIQKRYQSGAEVVDHVRICLEKLKS
jgi:CHASE2 domain-containing sensor protein/tRNA A-37 threonylcarbamoyl transferase component Bud32